MKDKYKELYANLISRSEELEERLDRVNASKRKEHSRGEDQAIERENDEVVDFLGETILKELDLIQDVISKIENGTYGICSKCGETIGKKRLEALPYTTYCINCAS